MANLNRVIYLSLVDYNTLMTNGSVTISGTTINYNANDVYIVPEGLATPTESGAMSAMDKAKLDKLPSLNASGKFPNSVIPSLAIVDTFVCSSQAAMLALDAEQGDVCVRTDINKTFILQSSPASTLANWIELQTGAGITGILMNNASKGTSGVVDLGKVVTNIVYLTSTEYNTLITTGTVTLSGGIVITYDDHTVYAVEDDEATHNAFGTRIESGSGSSYRRTLNIL